MLRCLVCGFIVPSVAVLRLHSFVFYHLNPFLCDICDLSFPNILTLHEVSCKYCLYCLHFLNSILIYIQHFSSSPNHPIYQSLQSAGLGIQYEDEPNADTWMDSDSRINECGSDLRNSECLRCKLWFKDTQELRAHYNISPLHHWCFICNRYFKLSAGLDAVGQSILVYDVKIY